MQTKPSVEHRYKSLIFDSERWSRFTPRDGDVVVCTCYKAGTTWTQMMCALLIHQSPELPSPLAELSPWLDMQLSPIDEVIANFESQTTRRVIKTHTPLDGFPYFDNVSYVYCTRDPRDIFMSMQNHVANLDYERAVGLMRAQGLGLRILAHADLHVRRQLPGETSPICSALESVVVCPKTINAAFRPLHRGGGKRRSSRLLWKDPRRSGSR